MKGIQNQNTHKGKVEVEIIKIYVLHFQCWRHQMASFGVAKLLFIFSVAIR